MSLNTCGVDAVNNELVVTPAKPAVADKANSSVDDAERALAIELADNVRGVKSVNAKDLTI